MIKKETDSVSFFLLTQLFAKFFKSRKRAKQNFQSPKKKSFFWARTWRNRQSCPCCLTVIELGGNGWFKRHLAQKAKSVIALDSMKNLKNEEENRHFANIEFVKEDQLHDASMDLAFSNWNLNYWKLFKKVLGWLRPGGYFFFRVLCSGIHIFRDTYLSKSFWTNPNPNPDSPSWRQIFLTCSLQEMRTQIYSFEWIWQHCSVSMSPKSIGGFMKRGGRIGRGGGQRGRWRIE